MRSSTNTEARKSRKPASRSKARSGNGAPSKRVVQPQPDRLDARTLLAALKGMRRGDFSTRLPEGLTGIDGQIADVFNEIAETQQGLTEELGELTHVICVEGRTQQRLPRTGARGGWASTRASVNAIVDRLSRRAAEMARVVDAVSKGDLTQLIEIEGDGEEPLRGDFLRHALIVNGMVEQLGVFGSAVTRVAREVGVEGKLGAQAKVEGVSGAWKELTDNVNLMADNLTNQVRDIAQVTTAVAQGDLTKKITVEVRGEILQLKNTINTMVDQLGSFADEVTRVAREVGTEGVLGGQAEVKGVAGTWRELTENVNSMARNLTNQVRNIATVTTAVANGDLSKKITVEVKGEMLALKNTINTMVDQLSSFASEVTRVAREVGTEGVLGGQADVKGVSGMWRDLTENVNSMANNLTDQVRNIAEVATAIAGGDLSRKITVGARGEILTLKNTINAMVDRLQSFQSEVTRVARLVGTEGTLGVQAEVKDVSGVWKELSDNVNQMANNLTAQVRNIAEVTTAVANGDLSRKITVEVRGEILQLKNTINQMVDSLNAFGSEVTRMARDVGTEGILGGQAIVRDVSGIWKELTDNVNQMANNLTSQVRNIAEVASAVASGDLSKKITVGAKGEILDLKDTVNTMVDQLNAFGAEVTRLARDVGVEGKLGGQARVEGVRGLWKELTDNVNLMASNLTDQVRDIAEVTTAVAKGDLGRKITVDAKGEILELKSTINTMVDHLSSFASEVTRLARDVGLEGKLGGQADVRGVAGTWRDLTDNVNLMASNLTDQVRNISQVATAIAQGDLIATIVVDARGEMLALKNTINTMVAQLRSFAEEVTRVAREVGTEGKLGGQAEVDDVAGTWRELTDNVNLMASNLTNQVRDIAQVTTAVAQGDLSKTITVEVRGEILQLKNTINTMVAQLRSFAGEVTRVAREVGTEGVLGGQAEVQGVSGVWQQLTENVNTMARNLTEQVRGIARVVTAVANGDLKQQLTLQAKGEIATLAETINNMILTLSTFADQVTNVARDVGVKGELGGQADVPGAAGIWRDLTDNVNELAGNLTNQVRAIGDVATAVTKGDLTQTIIVEARGEVAVLKDNINQMIATLAETTRLNQEQDWLKTNLTKFTRMLQGQRDLLSVARQVMSELALVIEAQHGVFYVAEQHQGEPVLRLYAAYAHRERKTVANRFALGEGLVGQCALEKSRILLVEAPADYITISSGLGEAKPVNIVVVPIVFEGDVKGVVELASFNRFTETQLNFLEQLFESLGIVIATIEANQRTEELLKQSQSLAEELQIQQDELQQTNEELEHKARQVSEQKAEVERKNAEVESAKVALEEKAEQLALTSKYKSQFLANMSHELRTPLNSLLILSQQLAQNAEGNLTSPQIEYAKTIYGAGVDLLGLIEEVLDMAKIESGTMAIDVADVPLSALSEHVQRSFVHVAEERKLKYVIDLHPELPDAIRTDGKRLSQILRNLLSNAFKFTHEGSVKLQIRPVTRGWSPAVETLEKADRVIAFSVTDTGIGIPRDRHALIFEAFQQADGGTARKYGGTGLGLSISREIAGLLGGEIRVESQPGAGSTFTLYLPETYAEARAIRSDTMSMAMATPAPLAINGEIDPSRRPTTPLLVDDRASIIAGDRTLLVIDDDDALARSLREATHTAGLKVVIARDGADGLVLASKIAPHAITLGLDLPDMHGWVVLDRLKHEAATRHIPVYVVSGGEDEARSLLCGAIGHLRKPADDEAVKHTLEEIVNFVEREDRRLLVVEDDETQRRRIVEIVGDEGVAIEAVASAEEALDLLEKETFDCMVLDLKLPGMSGRELMEKIKSNGERRPMPIIVYTGRTPTPDEDAELRELAESVVVKDATSMERLLEQTSLFLHQPQANLNARQREALKALHESDPTLRGKKVLIVDDDVRNIFAITSVVERHKMVALHAESGQDALDVLMRNPDVDIVLMDIMMPGMDGYEAIRRIRKQPEHERLPIVALTAKAMRGDRGKCLEAGASDYLSKPVSAEQLVSLLRVWLYEPIANWRAASDPVYGRVH